MFVSMLNLKHNQHIQLDMATRQVDCLSGEEQVLMTAEGMSCVSVVFPTVSNRVTAQRSSWNL